MRPLTVIGFCHQVRTYGLQFLTILVVASGLTTAHADDNMAADRTQGQEASYNELLDWWQASRSNPIYLLGKNYARNIDASLDNQELAKHAELFECAAQVSYETTVFEPAQLKLIRGAFSSQLDGLFLYVSGSLGFDSHLNIIDALSNDRLPEPILEALSQAEVLLDVTSTLPDPIMQWEQKCPQINELFAHKKEFLPNRSLIEESVELVPLTQLDHLIFATLQRSHVTAVMVRLQNLIQSEQRESLPSTYQRFYTELSNSDWHRYFVEDQELSSMQTIYVPLDKLETLSP